MSFGRATDTRTQAFKVFDIAQQNEFGAKEIRCVMQAVADMDVKTLDAHKMIEAAASTPDKKSITFEEFKQIIQWKPPKEKL